MGLVQQHRGRGFVDLAGFDPNEAVFDHVDPADPVLSGELVETLHEIDALDLRSVEPDRYALVKPDLDLVRLRRRFVGIDRPLEDVARGGAPRILEHAGLDRAPPEIHVDAVRALLRRLNGDAVLLRIVDLLVARHVHAATHRRDHREVGRKSADREVEPHLIVALSSAAVRDEARVLRTRGVHEKLRQERAAERRRQRITVLVERSSLKCRPYEVTKEDVAGVLHDRLSRATRDGLALDGVEIASRAKVPGAGDDLKAERLAEPRDGDAGVEAARVRQDAGLAGVLLAHFVPFRAMPNVVSRPRSARAWRSVVAAMKTVSSPARVPTASSRRDASSAAASAFAVPGSDRKTTRFVASTPSTG